MLADDSCVGRSATLKNFRERIHSVASGRDGFWRARSPLTARSPLAHELAADTASRSRRWHADDGAASAAPPRFWASSVR